ncbi:MAG: phage holin family protein [Thermodesulfovibrionales bacterium]
MEQTLIRWLINTISIMLAIRFVPGISYEGDWWGILAVGLIFGLVNALIRPFVTLFTFPLLILTLGLFTFVINAMMLGLTSWVSGGLGLGFHVAGFRASFWGALVISLVSTVLSCLAPRKDDERGS